MARFVFQQGDYGEAFPWQIWTENTFVAVRKGSDQETVCQHAIPVSPEKLGERPSGHYDYYFVPRLVVAENQGGHDSTRVCLDCILEAAASLPAEPKGQNP